MPDKPAKKDNVIAELFVPFVLLMNTISRDYLFLGPACMYISRIQCIVNIALAV